MVSCNDRDQLFSRLCCQTGHFPSLSFGTVFLPFECFDSMIPPRWVSLRMPGHWLICYVGKKGGDYSFYCEPSIRKICYGCSINKPGVAAGLYARPSAVSHQRCSLRMNKLRLGMTVWFYLLSRTTESNHAASHCNLTLCHITYSSAVCCLIS